jgi:hypothetical protein
MKDKQKQIEFFGKKYFFTSIENYLSSNKNRGISFTDRRLGLKYHMIKNCIVFGLHGQQILPIEKNNTVIFEESFAYDHDEHGRWSLLYHNFQEEKSFDFINIDEAVPLYHVWSRNFWHWTLECLPKVLALEDRGYSGKYIVFDSKFIIESLKLFNISEDRILYSDNGYIVKNLIVPPMYSGYDLSHKIVLVEYIRNKLLDAVGILSGNNRLYIKRTKDRIVLNEDKIIDILNKYDFDVIVPENYSVKEQFRIMTNVDFSVMAHGANCTLVFTQKMNSVFMELFSSAYIAYHSVSIIKTLNLDYIPLVEGRNEPIVLDNDKKPQYCDITVSIPIFETLISNTIKRITKN